MQLSQQDWLNVVGSEYLDTFIKLGGASVKFVVPSPESVPADIHEAMAQQSRSRGFHFACLDSGNVRVNMIDHIWFGLAQSLDWDILTREFVADVLEQNGVHVKRNPTSVLLEDIANQMDRSQETIELEIRRWLDRAVFQDPNMSLEYRWAMFRLCLAQVTGQQAEVDEVIRWYQGFTKSSDVLRSIGIRQPIARNIARHLIHSLSYWLTKAGKVGVVIGVDLSRLVIEKRPLVADGLFYYGPSAKLDVYEVLREFVDATDELNNCLIYVLAPPPVVTNEKTGIAAYKALKIRVWDEVHDAERVNPMSGLVRTTPAAPVLTFAGLATTSGKLAYQRAIEALRSGVPSRDVVMELGIPTKCSKPFRTMLERLQTGTGMPPTCALLLSGEFGSGKSHTLEFYRHVALDENMICSKVVASKETPLFDWDKLLRAIVESATVPGKTGSVVTILAEALKPRTTEFEALMAFVNAPANGLSDIFSATLTLFESASRELKEWIVKFWAGGRANLGQFRPALKALGRRGDFQLTIDDTSHLAQQRLRFLGALAKAVEYGGWVVLIDEVELIGRYSVQQRAKSYALVARLAGLSRAKGFPGFLSVLSCTYDFASVVLEGKGDLSKLPSKMATSKNLAPLVKDAVAGMEWLQRSNVHLSAPDKDAIDQIYAHVRRMHCWAYQWDAPEVQHDKGLSTTPMRTYVRSWITAWDLKRADPMYESHVEAEVIKLGYDEDTNLEKQDEPSDDGVS